VSVTGIRIFSDEGPKEEEKIDVPKIRDPNNIFALKRDRFINISTQDSSNFGHPECRLVLQNGFFYHHIENNRKYPENYRHENLFV
jgi:hypothetical protein